MKTVQRLLVEIFLFFFSSDWKIWRMIFSNTIAAIYLMKFILYRKGIEEKCEDMNQFSFIFFFFYATLFCYLLQTIYFLKVKMNWNKTYFIFCWLTIKRRKLLFECKLKKTRIHWKCMANNWIKANKVEVARERVFVMVKELERTD